VQMVFGEALIDRGELLAQAGREDEAQAFYQDVIERFGRDRAPVVIDVVRRARRLLA
jgi:hypothetical protein